MKYPDLKPCPFCGNPAEVDTLRGYSQYPIGKPGTSVAIYCTVCSCDMSLCREDCPGIDSMTLVDTLASMWNARMTQPETTTTG